MDITAFHAKYFAHDLTRRCASDSVEKLATALSGEVKLAPRSAARPMMLNQHSTWFSQEL